MILGRKGQHAWTPATGSSAAATLNQLEDDAGVSIWPRVYLKETGLAGLGDAEDNRDPRVGDDGEIPRPSKRRGKTLPYEGTVEAQSARQLLEYQAELRGAFSERNLEGRMDVVPHPLSSEFDVDEDSRYFNARVLGLDMKDLPYQPGSLSPYQSTFVLALRMSDGRYFEELTLASFKQAILDLDMEGFYWACDTADGADDLSGNGNDGAPQGGLVIGGDPALTPITGDDSTDLGGAASAYISTAYEPLAAAGAVATFVGLAHLVAGGGNDVLLWLDGGTANLQLDSADGEPHWIETGVNISLAPNWPAEVVVWSLFYDGVSNSVELSHNGSVVGQGTDADLAGGLADGFRLGGFPLAGLGFDGRVGHIMCFERDAREEAGQIAEWATTGRRAYW